jgi:hypothetical protein
MRARATVVMVMLVVVVVIVLVGVGSVLLVGLLNLECIHISHSGVCRD